MQKQCELGVGMDSAEDAVEAVRRGASAIVLSNHGGRQLDTVPAAVSTLVLRCLYPTFVHTNNCYYIEKME